MRKTFPPDITLEEIATKCRGMSLRQTAGRNNPIYSHWIISGIVHQGYDFYLGVTDIKQPLMDIWSGDGWSLSTITDTSTLREDDINAIIDRLNEPDKPIERKSRFENIDD